MQLRIVFGGACLLVAVLLSGCSSAGLGALSGASLSNASLAPKAAAPTPMASVQGHDNLDALISQYAAVNNVPVTLIHRVIDRESDYNPGARNGSYYGLMQISQATAQSMGYDGSASGLLDAETNLKYATKYLAGAWIVGGQDEDQAIRNYSRGYYYDAKRKGLLEESGLR